MLLSESNRNNSAENQVLNHEYEKLQNWFQTVKFRKVLFGGVDEVQLWKKLEELNKLYEAAVSAERARYDALIGEYKKKADTWKSGYEEELEERKTFRQSMEREDSESRSDREGRR